MSDTLLSTTSPTLTRTPSLDDDDDKRMALDRSSSTTATNQSTTRSVAIATPGPFATTTTATALPGSSCSASSVPSTTATPGDKKARHPATMIELVAKDQASADDKILVPYSIAALSYTVHKALDEDLQCNIVHLNQIDRGQLVLVVYWLNLYKDGTAPMTPRKPVRKDEKDAEIFASDYERLKSFFRQIPTMAVLYSLINAANYLDIQPLLHQLCAVIGRRLKEKLDINMVKSQLDKNAIPFPDLVTSAAVSSTSSSSSFSTSSTSSTSSVSTTAPTSVERKEEKRS
jgi:hypothetical protein